MRHLVPVLIAGVIGGPLVAQTLPEFDPALPFEVTGLAEGSALVTSGGAPFLCTLEKLQDTARLGTCTPIVTDGAAAAAQSARDEDTAALDQVTARANAADADAAAAEIAALQAEVRSLRDRLAPYLAADAAAAEASALLDRVIALEQAAVAFGLMTDDQIVPAAMQGLDKVMRDHGEACSLSLATVEANGGERWLQDAVYGAMMDGMDIPADIRDLLLSYMFDAPNDKASERGAFADEVDTTSDDEVYKKANHAVGLVQRNLERLEETVEAAMRDPAYITLAADRQSVTLVDCQ